MKHPKLNLTLGSGLALLVVLCGCSSPKGPTFDARAKGAGAAALEGTTVTNELDAGLFQSGTEFFKLGPGDVIDVEVLGNAVTRATLTVGPDGKIYFYVLHGVDVWGLTLAEAKKLLQMELSKYVTGAQVSVTLRSVGSKSVWVLGRVSKPGVYPMSGPLTLLEGVALAGGTAGDEADLRHSFVQRGGQFLPVDFQKLLAEGDMSQNIYLQPDDFIYMPSTLFHEVFVLGAVKFPRTVPYTERITLLSAVANANGPVPGAYLSHVAVVRGSLSQPKVAIVNYRNIISGKEPDVRLDPHDIVYIPFQPFNGLKAYAKVILGTFVNTVAANEGANFVSSNGEKVGISVGPGGSSSGGGSATGTSTGGSGSSGNK